MVILLVLGMLILLVIFTTQLGDAGISVQTLEDRVRLKEQNYQVARSAVELAMDLLRVDGNKTDSASDVWNIGSQKLTWEGRDLFLEIRDEESRFPLSQLPIDAKSPPDLMLYQQALERLLDRAGLGGPQAVGVLMDWLDPDDQVRNPGAEQGSYSGVFVKNGPLDDLGELERMQGWGLPALPPPPSLDPGGGRLEEYAPMLNENNGSKAGSSNWGDWLSAHAQGKINVNTAPAEVLRCLDQAMSDSVVTEIVALRSRNTLKSEEDLKKIPGIDQDLAFRLNKLVGFSSQVFRVRVVVTSANTPLDMEVMLERKSQRQIVVRYWRAR